MVVKDIMKCPKKKKCESVSLLRGKKHYICIGFCKKPLKYKKDIVNLCLEGKYVNNFLVQMTPKEALVIGAGLLNAIGIE